MPGQGRTSYPYLGEVVAPETRYANLQRINVGMESIKGQLGAKCDEILHRHYYGHPITYNHYLIDVVQKVQQERRDKELRAIIKDHVGSVELHSKVYLSPSLLYQSLSRHVEVDMDKFASSSAIDYMEAYFKVRSLTLLLPLNSRPIYSWTLGISLTA